MQLNKENTVGIIVTLAIHALVLLALLFMVLSLAPPPDPPLGGGGMEIDFGMSTQGSGTNEMALPTGPVVSENPSNVQTPVKASQSTPEEVMTSEKGEDEISMPKPNKKPVQETVKPVEKPKPVINQGALLPGKTNTGGQGSSNTPGNEGRLDGMPGKRGQGGTGDNPDGTGNGSGNGSGSGPGGGKGPVKINMTGRSVQSMPSFTYTEQEDGMVVVKVTADRTGKVINATTDGVRGSTTTNNTLHALAIANAKKVRFNESSSAAPEQIGYITYVFERK
jgi:hypothetical protein